jgi:hypothetical protein
VVHEESGDPVLRGKLGLLRPTGGMGLQLAAQGKVRHGRFSRSGPAIIAADGAALLVAAARLWHGTTLAWPAWA